MEKDVTQNVYFMDPRRFADLVNGYVGHGKQLILPQNLENMDARSGMYKIPDFEGKADFASKKKTKNRIKYSDVRKKAFFGKRYLVIGIENYGVHVIEVRKLEDTSVFRTDIRQVFDFIRYSSDAEKLKELVENDPEFRHLAEDAYDVIAQYAKAPELLEQKENSTGKDGKVNMCKALNELITDGEARGEARMGDLYTILMNEKRFDDMKRAASDRAYRNRLFAKYHISGTAE